MPEGHHHGYQPLAVLLRPRGFGGPPDLIVIYNEETGDSFLVVDHLIDPKTSSGGIWVSAWKPILNIYCEPEMPAIAGF